MVPAPMRVSLIDPASPTVLVIEDDPTNRGLFIALFERAGILEKPGALAEDEWIDMRRQPITGEQTRGPVASSREVAPIVGHHHERWDGASLA